MENKSLWGKILNIVITVLTAIATTFGVSSCIYNATRNPQLLRLSKYGNPSVGLSCFVFDKLLNHPRIS